MSRTGLWDSHAHLDDEAFNEDREQLIAQLEQDMDGIVNPGCDAASSAVAVELAEKYPFIYAAVGWHPENLKGIPADYLQQLAEWAQHPKVVAIGEIGLDYYWKENEPKEVQKRIFLEQIDLAKQFDLEMAKELAKRGYYFGFGGTSTYKNAQKVREVMQYIPKELLLFETDSPYLTPVPFRGKRNNPGYTEYTARNAAQVLGMDFEELAAIATANTKRLFKKIK